MFLNHFRNPVHMGVNHFRNPVHMFLNPSSNSVHMLLNLFRNPVHVSLALQCIANIGSKDMAEAFGAEIPKLLVSG